MPRRQGSKSLASIAPSRCNRPSTASTSRPRSPGRPRRGRATSICPGAKTDVDLSVFSPSETVLLESAIERAAAQPEGFRRFPRVPVVSRERFLDQKLFDFFEPHVLEALRLAAGSRQTKIVPLDLRPARHQDRALDHVVELAHVSRIRMLHQSIARPFIKPRELFAVTLRVIR